MTERSLTEELKRISPDVVNRESWEMTGMVLKGEGYPREAWEEWTRQGSAHDPAECAALWPTYYPEGIRVPMFPNGRLPDKDCVLTMVRVLGRPAPTEALDAPEEQTGTERTPEGLSALPQTENDRFGDGLPVPVSLNACRDATGEPAAERTPEELSALPQTENDRFGDGLPAPVPLNACRGAAGEPAVAERTPERLPARPKREINIFGDGLPMPISLNACKDNPPPLPEELIRGVLRRGHKMLLSGSSKAGKSFLLMELCVALAEGREWLGFPCRRGKVLYVNLEIDPASVTHRFLNIYRALGLPLENAWRIYVWNLRGHAMTMDRLTRPLIERLLSGLFDAVVIDPIYKVLPGDENSATEVAAFCNQLDAVCEESGCAVIYCHHHSKGDQSGRRVADRASGSGVFSRDPDAQLDIIELETDERQRRAAKPGATAWRMESRLREFPSFPPVDFWFEYPVHRADEDGALADALPPKRPKS